MELIISIAALVISLCAFFIDRASLKDQAYDRFTQLLFGMDEVFIEHPEMHKYFYPDEQGKYAELKEDSEEFELAVCIAQRFSDAFQYTAPLEKHLNESNRKSYTAYKNMISESPALKGSLLVNSYNKKYN